MNHGHLLTLSVSGSPEASSQKANGARVLRRTDGAHGSRQYRLYALTQKRTVAARTLEHIRLADCLGSGAAAALSAVGASLAPLSPSSFVLRASREGRRRLCHGGGASTALCSSVGVESGPRAAR